MKRIGHRHDFSFYLLYITLTYATYIEYIIINRYCLILSNLSILYLILANNNNNTAVRKTSPTCNTFAIIRNMYKLHENEKQKENVN